MVEFATLLLEDGAQVPERLLGAVDAVVEISNSSPVCRVRSQNSKGIETTTTAVFGGLFEQALAVEAAHEKNKRE